jgi:hypothetical protein
MQKETAKLIPWDAHPNCKLQNENTGNRTRALLLKIYVIKTEIPGFDIKSLQSYTI